MSPPVRDPVRSPEELLGALDGMARIVDLSLLLAEDLPCSWPGHMPYQHKLHNWFADRSDELTSVSSKLGPYHTRWLLMDEHTGTHFDAPTHSVPPPESRLPGASATGDISVDLIPPGQTIGPAVVIDASHLADSGEPGTSPEITVGELHSYERRRGSVNAGDVVLLRTGWDRHYVTGPQGNAYIHDCAVARSTPGWPSPTDELIEALADRGVRCVGTDGVSMGALDDGARAHATGLARGMVFVEGLSNLSQLPARGAWFIFLGLKLRDGSGAPGRAIALLPRSESSERSEGRVSGSE